MISVLTPTFNRSSLLLRLFESLMAQSSRDFEWVVVDDGSTDDTVSRVQGWASAADFPVRLLRQPNSGKHVAVNHGVAHCAGGFVFIVDSDDFLTHDAVAVVEQALARLGTVRTGVCFRRGDLSGRVIGKEWPNGEPLQMHPSDAARAFAGDLAYVFAREALVRHPFPVFQGEKFVPELYVWSRIGDEAPISYFPASVIYLCEYQSDGYSANFRSNLRRNPRGFALYYRDQLRRGPRLLDRLKCLVRLAQCAFNSLAAGADR